MSKPSQIHVILADYNETRLQEVAAGLQGLGAVVHLCRDRIEALGKYWMLYAEGILPRAVVASWLMDTPDSRSFFSAVGREVDHTSISLFVNVANLDPDGILVCYAESLPEAITEIEASGVADKVVLIQSCTAAHVVADIIRQDRRSQVVSSRTSGPLSDRHYARTARLSR